MYLLHFVFDHDDDVDNDDDDGDGDGGKNESDVCFAFGASTATLMDAYNITSLNLKLKKIRNSIRNQ